MKPIKKILYFVLLFFGNAVFAQHYELIKNYTTENGLPSNLTYDFEQDKNGFLWIATNNAASRFDGKFFYNYGIRNGLPSNDAIQIVKEKNGQIWVSCFKQTPSFFDEKRNIFINISGNKFVDEACNSVLKCYPLADGGVGFSGNNVFFQIKNQKIKSCTNSSDIVGVFANFNFKILPDKKKQEGITLEDNQKSIAINLENIRPNCIKFTDNSIFIAREKEIFLFSNFQNKPFRFQQNTVRVSDKIKLLKIANSKLVAVSENNRVFLIDINSLKVEDTISFNTVVNSAFVDKDENLWVATLREGIFLFKKNAIKKHLQDIENNAFLSLSVSPQNKILAGNFSGAVYEIDAEQRKSTKLFANTAQESWIRKIMFSHQKPLLLTDNFYSFEGKAIKLYNEKGSNYALKQAEKVDEENLLIGTIDGLFQHNLKDKSLHFLALKNERIFDLKRKNADAYYIVSATGLYLFSWSDKKIKLVYKSSNLGKIAANQHWLFISNTLGEILIFKDEKLFTKIENSAGLPENISNILFHKNRLFITSKTGLCVIDLDLPAENFSKNIITITDKEGLGSNVLYDILAFKNSIFVSSENGVSEISDDFTVENLPIKPIILALKIKEKAIPIAEKYELNSREKNVNILFSGVELTGHFKNIQYQFNNEKNWNNLEGNSLNLQLDFGENLLKYRAVDNNNVVASDISTVIFDVQIPFYNRFWFWLLVGGMLFGSLFYAYGRYKFLRQKAYYKHQLDLEKQRNKITADLHDDLGSALSSLQINSAIAGKMMKKNPEEAQKILDKIESQSQKISENIGDIIWSLKPGKHELMSLSMRIRNFANEILGSTNINYQIDIDENIDTEITDFTERKNIILIAKEAINNAAKYSNARNVTISIQKQENHYWMLISDDGKGFDITKTKGNGIGNMQRRAEEISGNFQVFSNENGTQIKVYIPIFSDNN